MKGWRNIAAVSGFLVVLAFAVERFLRVQTLWGILSWADLRDFADFGLFILMNAAMLLALIAILWGGYLWLGKPPENRLPKSSSVFQVIRVAGAAVLSVVVALAAGGSLKMHTPGWLVAGTLNKPGKDLNLGLLIGSAIVVDSALCFAILWGGYLLWTRFRRGGLVHRSNR